MKPYEARKTRARWALAALPGMLVANLAGAVEPAVPAPPTPDAVPEAGVVPPIPPPPPGFDSKRPLTRDDYERKNERGYFTGLPLFNFDPNTGFGFGARGYYYYNGERSDPLFAYTPYLHRIFLQAFTSTGGLQFHWLDYDAPAVAGTPYRIRSQLIYARNTSQHFFGIGSDAMGPLTFTGAGRNFEKWSEYDEQLRTLRSDGTALSRYDHFDMVHPVWLISIERTFFDGVLRPLFGLGFSYTKIDDYTGETVDALDDAGNEVEAVMGPTRLSERCALDLVGCQGGWDNGFRFGVSFDTRDFEPDPNSGVFADIALDLSTRVLGSEYSYARFLTSVRYFVSPLPETVDLVLATRGTFQVQSQGAPFFSMSILPYTEDFRTGLGGHRTLRGFQQDRFVGHVMSLLNLELRWTFHRFVVFDQKFAMMAVPFLDTGRVFDSVREFSFQGWRRGQGAGFRMSWNLATVVSVDYGFSSEDSGLYVNFNHQF